GQAVVRQVRKARWAKSLVSSRTDATPCKDRAITPTHTFRKNSCFARQRSLACSGYSTRAPWGTSMHRQHHGDARRRWDSMIPAPWAVSSVAKWGTLLEPEAWEYQALGTEAGFE